MESKFQYLRFIFSAIVILAFGYGIYEAFSYAYLAKIFPLYISLVLFILAVINFIQEIMDSRKGARVRARGAADLESEWGDLGMSEVLRRFAVFVAVVIVLYALIWLIGYPLSITLFIIVLYRYITRTKWHWAIVAGLAGLGFLALVSKLLYMDWPEGIFKLPWPLG
ncbi:MAG: tripartite tricarboxylate transporter TctB family protein [Deltaproteobacteria bacterium]|nr:MAG: tripartite tricarboxylate transporter TctB family protein [Deltaproteobacteria bacterium]